MPAFFRHFIALLVLLCSLGAWAQTPQRPSPHDEVERLLRNGQFDRALTQIQDHLASTPRDPQMRLLLARLQAERGDRAQAIDTLRALTLEFPELPEPHNNLAVLLAAQGQWSEAIQSLELALRQRPDDALALENLGDLHLGLALQAYRRSTANSARQKAQGIDALLAPSSPLK